MTALLDAPDATDDPADPTSEILGKAKQLRDAGASIDQIKGWLATKGHIGENGFTPFVDAPVEPTPTRPGLVSRAGSRVLDAVKQAATHPIDTAAGIAAAPFRSLSDAMGPGVGELRHDPRLSKGGNSSGAPIDLSAYDAQHGGVTTDERLAGMAQTLANLVAPGLSRTLPGLAAAGGIVNAAYSPDDPAAGFLSGAILAPGVKLGAKAVPTSLSAVRNIPIAAVRDVGLSAVGSNAAKLRLLGRIASAMHDAGDAAGNAPPTVEGYQTPIDAAGHGQTIPPGARSRQSIPGPALDVEPAPTAMRAAPPATDAAPADASGVSDADRARMAAMGVPADVIAKATVKLTPADIVRSADPIAGRSSPSPLSLVSDADASAPSRHRTAAQFAEFAKRTGTDTPAPGSIDARIRDLVRQSGITPVQGPFSGDAEEAMGLAPHQQPDLEDLLRRSLAGEKRP